MAAEDLRLDEQMGPPRRVFELLGLVGTFHLVDTRQEAIDDVTGRTQYQPPR